MITLCKYTVHLSRKEEEGEREGRKEEEYMRKKAEVARAGSVREIKFQKMKSES